MAMRSMFIECALKIALGATTALAVGGAASAHGSGHGGGNGSSGYSAGASGERVNPIVNTIHPIVRNPIVNTIHPILATSTVVRDHRGPCGAPSGGVTVSTTGGSRHSGANGYRGPGGIHCNP